MARKPESGLQRRIQKALRAAFPGCYVRKIHVSEYQSGGISDLICCVRGRFVSLEVKEPGSTPSKLQEYEMDQVTIAGGIALVVKSPQQAIAAVHWALQQDVD